MWSSGSTVCITIRYAVRNRLTVENFLAQFLEIEKLSLPAVATRILDVCSPFFSFFLLFL